MHVILHPTFFKIPCMHRGFFISELGDKIVDHEVCYLIMFLRRHAYFVERLPNPKNIEDYILLAEVKEGALLDKEHTLLAEVGCEIPPKVA